MRIARWLVPIALAVLATPAARAEEDDLLATVYTESGYELRRDERLFALFAAFNVAGLDRADELRTVPFPKRTYHPIRTALRDALTPLSDKLRPPVDLFLDTHPASIDQYVAAALLLGDEPEFHPEKALPPELAGLDHMLMDFARNAKLSKLGRQLGTDYRAEFKKLRDVVDAPLAAVRAAFRLKEEDAPALVLVPMPLDGPGHPVARRSPDGTHIVVFGVPAQGTLAMGPVLDAYARLLAEEATQTLQVDGLKEAIDQLKAANIAPASTTPAFALAESYRAAVGAKLGWKDAQAEVEQGARKGFVLAREFVRALDEPAANFPAEKGSFAAQVAARADLKKLVAEASGKSDAPPAKGKGR